MQNIGAYGVELKEVFDALEAIHIESGEMHRFNKEECKFGYRESIFKTSHKNQYVITAVHFKVSKQAALNTSYGAIEEELRRMQISKAGIKEVSDAVCNIRRSKLPDPLITGNAGSFFKNPEVLKSIHDELKLRYPELVAYPLANGNMKLAAGWLIEHCGWKGKALGRAGVHSKQALVLVNLGGANGNEVLQLSLQVKASVREKFGVELETEVNII
jgi:UDP-N-acetylmuramate dehydrogenase